MKINGFARMLLVATLLGLFGCGGGGGGGTSSNNTNPTPTPTPTPKATTTISGTVEFPSLSNLVAKRVGAAADTITVQAFTLEGTAVGTPVTATGGAYTLPDLPPGVDYVIKCTRGTQVLKKLIEKVAVTPGVEVSGMTVDQVSMTAVVVASQKLAAAASLPSLNLGEPTTLTDTQKNTISTTIFTSVAPATLEQTISDTAAKIQEALTVQAAINNGQDAAAPDLSGVTSDLVGLVNMMNIVVAAVSNNADVNQVISGQTQINQAGAEKKFQPITVSGAEITQGPVSDTVSSTVVTNVAAAAVQYTPPPRVALDISTNAAANTLYGITFEVTVPSGANLVVNSAGKVEMGNITLASGVLAGTLIDTNYNATTRKLRILIGGTVPLPTGKLVTVVFDRIDPSPSFVPTAATAVDKNGTSILSSLSVTGTSN